MRCTLHCAVARPAGRRARAGRFLGLAVVGLWSISVGGSAQGEPRPLVPSPEAMRHARLLGESDPVPRALQVAVVAELEGALRLEAAQLAHDFPAEAGGGDGNQVTNEGGVAFAVGALAGFGLGHFLIAHEPGRGTLWLAIDAGTLIGTIVLFAFLLPLGIIFLAGFVVERVLQGLDAMALTHSGGFPYGSAAPAEGAGQRWAGLPSLLAVTF